MAKKYTFGDEHVVPLQESIWDNVLILMFYGFNGVIFG